ncbi:hypothetical protein BH11PSE3_BH11PSE3_02420 [soil metagenome]
MHPPRPAVLLLGFGLAALPAAASAAPLETAGASQCNIRAFAVDRDPKGTNLRSAPRADAPIIGHMAPLESIAPDTKVGVEFYIVGSKDGWLLIRDPDPRDGLKFDPANAADGRGWVSGKLITVNLRNAELRTAPRRSAPLVAELKGPKWGPDWFGVRIIHACQDKYIEVTGKMIDGTLADGPRLYDVLTDDKLKGKFVRGWSWSPCANQLTTCDPAARGEPE